MGKRLMDDQLDSQPWFRKAPPAIKCLWQYLLRTCDKAGVWEVDLQYAEQHVGEKIDWDTAREILLGIEEKGKLPRVVELSPSRWLLTRFMIFQYGYLSWSCYPHRKVWDAIDKHNLWKSYPAAIPPIKVPRPADMQTKSERSFMSHPARSLRADINPSSTDTPPQSDRARRFAQGAHQPRRSHIGGAGKMKF